jgi:hypothetical protein
MLPPELRAQEEALRLRLEEIGRKHREAFEAEAKPIRDALFELEKHRPPPRYFFNLDKPYGIAE